MTLLQDLLTITLQKESDPILHKFIETVVPAMEQEFSLVPALGGSEAVHDYRLQKDPYLKPEERDKKVKRWSQNSDQSLLVHVTNAILTAWNLQPFLDEDKELSDEEKRLLCLGLTLHDYNKYCQGEEEDSPKAHKVEDILHLCQELGEKLNFTAFWEDWKNYLSEIGFLAQNTQYKGGANPASINWPQFKIDSRRLHNPLRPMLAFGDIAVHMSDPADIITPKEGNQKRSRGHALQEHLNSLQINKNLAYHRLKDCTGLLSSCIHNAVLYFSQELNWQPILFFAQGVVYLAPLDLESPDRDVIQSVLWVQIQQLLASKMLSGEIGFKRDGKGLKVAPQTLELFTPAQLIRGLPDVVRAKVGNKKNPATPKRLAALELSEAERAKLEPAADWRSDRLAELIFLAQKEFLGDCPDFVPWVLKYLEIEGEVTPEQTQVQSGGVNYGWYHAAAHYIAVVRNNALDEEELQETLKALANELADWAEENDLLPQNYSPTQKIFLKYLNQNLEIFGWEQQLTSFEDELSGYVKAKTKTAKQPICSLSSGEFASEDQMDSVVLFKPQQYSNKNPLGGRQIKRGISKIWSLEMLLRQAIWAVPSGKLEDQRPVFLYIFPAYVFSPQMAKAIRVLMDELKDRLNFWDIRKFWQEHDMDIRALRSYSWLKEESEAGRFASSNYGGGDRRDLPFVAITYTTTRGKTVTDAWIEPAFLAIALPMLLGVKVVASTSPAPLYSSDNEFRESVKLDGPAGFWDALGLPTSLHLEEWIQNRVQRLDDLLNRLLIAYALHLDCEGDPPDPRWRAFANTVREIMTDVLNIFSLADSHFRDLKREPYREEVNRYWNYAQIWSEGDFVMREKLKVTRRLVDEYRKFYRANSGESSHTVLLPLSKALEHILSVPEDWDDEELILQGAGQLQAALDRQEVYKRPIIMDKSISPKDRRIQEFEAIQIFMTTCVKDVFGEMCKGDRALLQENRNRIKSGAEFAYRWLALQEKNQDEIKITQDKS
jgi:CRISPR-associated protein Csc3